MEKIIPNKIRQNENSFNICHKNTTSNTFKYRKHLSFDYILFILVCFKFFIVARLSKTPIRRSLQFKQKLCWHRKCNWLRVLCDSIFFLYPTILFEWLCWIKKLNRITLVKYKHTSMISTVFVWHIRITGFCFRCLIIFTLYSFEWTDFFLKIHLKCEPFVVCIFLSFHIWYSCRRFTCHFKYYFD